MAKYRIKKITDEKFTELARISFNLRYFSKIWKEHYGATNRNNMAHWEGKMDKWLSENLIKEKEDEIDSEPVRKPDVWTNAQNQ